MLKLLSISVLVLTVVLFPPAALAYFSQDAIPGETLYPVKRKLEEGILLIAKATPTTRSWFNSALVQRRYNETRALISKKDNDAAAQSLDELIDQTSVAVAEISQVQSSSQKRAFASNLSESMEEYSQGLQLAKEQLSSSNLASNNAENQISTDEDNDDSSLISASPKGSGTPAAATGPNPNIPTSFSASDEELEAKLEDALLELEDLQDQIERLESVENTSQNTQSPENAAVVTPQRIGTATLASELRRAINQYAGFFILSQEEEEGENDD